MKIKKMLKCIVKLHLANPDFKKQLHTMEYTIGEKWLIIGTPIHDNLGDHLITQAELEYLQELNTNVMLFDIPTEMFLLYKKNIQRLLSHRDKIFVNGGGWMGTLWQHDEYLMQDILLSFKNNTTIVFPQTIYYDKDNPKYHQVLIDAQKTWITAKKAVLCLRDKASYQFALKELMIETERCFLLPDIALLYHSPNNIVQKNNTVLLCLRNDREAVLPSYIQESIKDFISSKGLNYKYTSTLTKKVVSLKERKNCISQKINEFKKAPLIITDRLHGMIFSYLAGTPCIAFDNKTKKVSGVYNTWLNHLPSIILSEINTETILHNIECLLKYSFTSKEGFQKYFKKEYYSLERIIK